MQQAQLSEGKSSMVSVIEEESNGWEQAELDSSMGNGNNKKKKTPSPKRDKPSPVDTGISSSSSSSSSYTDDASSSPIDPVSPDPSPQWRLDGLILSCPALVPHSRSVSPLLAALAAVLAEPLPKFSLNVSWQLDIHALTSSLPVMRQYFRDPLVGKDPSVTARWGSEILFTMENVREGMGEISIPLLIQQGKGDRFISPRGAHFAYEKAGSKDKTLLLYNNSTHDIYFEDERHQVMTDAIQWLNQRTDTHSQGGW